jgi:hypothetical protein
LARGDILEAFPVGGDVAGVADGQEMEVGRAAKRVANLERGGLLALDAVGIDRVDDVDAGLVAPSSRTRRSASSKLPRRAIISAPYMRPAPACPWRSCRAGRSTTQRCRRARVGGGGGGGVARAGADDGLAPRLDGLGNGGGHAAVLEGCGGIEALVLNTEEMLMSESARTFETLAMTPERSATVSRK